MENKDIKLGNKYKIKSWEDMLRIGSINKYGSIAFNNSPVVYLESMKYLCGTVITIDYTDNNIEWYATESLSIVFTAEMLELIEELKEDKNIIKSNKKYVILDVVADEVVLNDNANPYFASLEDAKNYALECETNVQLLNILEVSNIFECELNFKEVK